MAVTDEEVLAAFDRIGQQRATARELGVSLCRVQGALRRAERPKPESDARDGFFVARYTTLTDPAGNVKLQWKQERAEDRQRERAWQEFADELKADLPRYAPAPVPQMPQNDDLLVGYPIADHHIGMLSWHEETGDSYDVRIGERLLTGAIDYLVEASPAAGTALVAFLGDFLHYDSFETVTPTNRNMLDSDSRYPRMIRAGVRVMRATIDAALRRHSRAHVVVESGNHDPAMTAFLAVMLEAVYENEPRVTVDTSPMHYHYFRFGEVLLGTHHGHGTKMANLPLIMAADRPADWGATKHRHWWTGHIHHSKTQAATSALDYTGCTVESFRILPPPDAWAHQKGYRPHRDMRAIVYHCEHGEVARSLVSPAMLG